MRKSPESPVDHGKRLRITVILLQRHVAALDHLAVSIRLRAGVALSRASIIDAFIAASLQKPDALVGQMLQERVPMSEDRTRERRATPRT